MIVILGSNHDPVAAALVTAWDGAALCSAEDLTRPGWVWRRASPASARWVVGGRIVRDEEVSGVFVRRSTVYPEELLSTHPADRRYLAAEAHAFLVFVLATTRARVANPVADGALGDEVMRPERWMPAAAEAGLPLAPLRLASDRALSHRWHPVVVEAVGDDAFGEAPARTKDAVRRMMRRLELLWATFVFDGRQRLVTITTGRTPGEQAAHALGHLLGAAVTV
ncbi:hypothetical protein J7E70_34720 [Variovorax paradoxus]|nr:hypothetical protein [Variovorax paradoxus]MBT2305547.1 hypothetical protein [Variovorax paradoxus]